AGEDRVRARAALPAEERAGDAPDGVHPLLDVHREREEVEVLLGLLGGRGGRQQHGLVVEVGDDGSGGLAREAPGLEPDGAGAEAPVVDDGTGLVHVLKRVGHVVLLLRRPHACTGLILGLAGLRSKPPGPSSGEPLPRTGGSCAARRGVFSARVSSCSGGNAVPARTEELVRAGVGSAAEAETLDQGPVARDVHRSQVPQQPAATADQQQQAAARGVVVLVLLQVLGEVADPLGEQRDLSLGRTGVARVETVGLQDLLLLCGVECHVVPLPSMCRDTRIPALRGRKAVPAATDCSRTRYATLPATMREANPPPPRRGAPRDRRRRVTPRAGSRPAGAPRRAPGRPGRAPPPRRRGGPGRTPGAAPRPPRRPGGPPGAALPGAAPAGRARRSPATGPCGARRAARRRARGRSGKEARGSAGRATATGRGPRDRRSSPGARSPAG